MDPEDIQHRFAFHAATTQEKRDAHSSIRQACRRLADHINESCPEGREKSLAITHVEEAMFWANAALARSLSG
ncbi:Acb2/Tad1 domain-containing protein [Streptomyces antibioticus]|uniref:Acb2/Tad1 domain-containing protein n=1 Tax=Streptomyces antibioticus TaxID=1890 RepID=UPI003F4CB611